MKNKAYLERALRIVTKQRRDLLNSGLSTSQSIDVKFLDELINNIKEQLNG